MKPSSCINQEIKRQEKLKRLAYLLTLLRYAGNEAKSLDQKFIAYLLSMTQREVEDRLNDLTRERVQ